MTQLKPLSRKPKVKKLGSAVFRGKAALYNFDVLPLTMELDDSPAVFVITRRVVDRQGRGHHAFICIGETETLSKTIRRHKRGNCVKRNDANVVCVIREPDEDKRTKVVTDLLAAHAHFCRI